MERTNVDWQAVERSPEFRELVKRRKAFVLPAAAAWIVIFGAYLLLAALAPDLMGERVLGVTFGFLFSLTQVLLTWVVTFFYLRAADREFEPLERRAAEVATHAARGGGEAG